MTSMPFADAARVCPTGKYATFSGRTRRAEYWWFALLCVLATGAVAGIGSPPGPRS
ncbi:MULTISPECIES: DUF805 domain-containing protein [Streptomyces]|uniref:DUF805 domain-containing protein n=1 Tax=Streptomyces TaxID=1883 RepID=UPI0011812A83|nr:DUF805 domain-containing protein [Streptomyces sp. 1222.2]